MFSFFLQFLIGMLFTILHDIIVFSIFYFVHQGKMYLVLCSHPTTSYFLYLTFIILRWLLKPPFTLWNFLSWLFFQEWINGCFLELHAIWLVPSTAHQWATIVLPQIIARGDYSRADNYSGEAIISNINLTGGRALNILFYYTKQ